MTPPIAVLLLVLVPGAALGQSNRQHPGDWSWMRDTYWYVTEKDLPAMSTDLATGQHQAVSDQTVWHIEDSVKGYIYGKTVIQLTGRPTSCATMVGSITPRGSVQITFTLPVGSLPPALSTQTSGIGTMQRPQGEWRFAMQMTTGAGTLVTHWADMKQCKAGEACNQRLPGADISLKDLLAKCGD